MHYELPSHTFKASERCWWLSRKHWMANHSGNDTTFSNCSIHVPCTALFVSRYRKWSLSVSKTCFQISIAKLFEKLSIRCSTIASTTSLTLYFLMKRWPQSEIELGLADVWTRKVWHSYRCPAAISKFHSNFNVDKKTLCFKQFNFIKT